MFIFPFNVLRIPRYERFRAGRVFKEVELAEPIRYAAGDTIEAWLNDLLCLNAADHILRITGRSVVEVDRQVPRTATYL